MPDPNLHHALLVMIAGKMLSVIDLCQLHAVIVDHTVGCDESVAICNQQNRRFNSVQIVQLFCGGATTMRIQIMLTANAPQIREVGNYRSLLTTEGEVDEVA